MLRLVPYGFLLFFTCVSSTFPAAACDVGTPNQEGSWLITSTDIGVIWTQTDTNQFDYWFDIDASPWEQSVGNYGPIVAPLGIQGYNPHNGDNLEMVRCAGGGMRLIKYGRSKMA